MSFIVGYLAFIRERTSFFPDSRYYLAMAFWFSGKTKQQAHDLTAAFAGHYNYPVPDVNTLFGWGLVQPRVVVPAIAAPFVRVFGPHGFTLATFLITCVLTVLLTIVLIRRFGNTAAVATMLVVNASPFLMGFNGGMLTESMSAVWSVLILLAAWRFQRTRQWWLIAAIAVITALSAFTRQATLIDVGALVMAWLLGSLFQRRNSPWMWPAIATTVATVVCQVLQSVLFPFSQSGQFERMTGTTSLSGALLATPRLAWRLLQADLHSFATSDHTLLFLLVFSLIGMVLFFRREESHLLLGAILAVALYNITNGNPTGFRYAVPGLVFYLMTFALLVSRTAQVVRDRRTETERPSADDETPIAASQ